ncbi:SLC13 family permease [Zhihengliuella flava]|uniref:Di/tricarboxylate transporter n=1 Tax=Zhihengliuella flava TaxID=1285193 RepID=A0A931GEM1_9MICC|nr:SLC13 family permease [Zhihengliuella flava]MBG6084260.1 di/tricarboxylate transporter [Zhihengliuella flava]
MPVDAILALGTVVAVLMVLITTRIAADVVLVSAVVFLMLTGILTPQEALSGFSNTGVLTIAALYVVAAALKESGAIQWLALRVLGQPKRTKLAQLRILGPAAGLSAFMNNTAVVAMLIPALQDWSSRLKIAPSKLMIPLSYACILGGTATVIGTSTNLVVVGLLDSEKDVQLSMFEPAWIGVPLVVVGGLYMFFFGNKLLPRRQGFLEQFQSAREYGVEVLVDANGPLVGKTIAAAGLRQLTHGYLAEIEREDQLMTAVSPQTVLRGGDALIFIGAPDCAQELRRIDGLTPADGHVQELNIRHSSRRLIEAIIGTDFSALGQSIRAAKFRTRYNAVVLAVSRHGKRLPGKLGDIELQVGDTLLLEAGDDFVGQYRHRKDFLMVSALNDSSPPDFKNAPAALGILLAMVVVSAVGLLSILEASFLAALALIAIRCVPVSKARREIDLSVLTVVAASFALGSAMASSGAAERIAGLLLFADGLAPWLALAMVYALTVFFTELITNNGAAVLMFPIAVEVAAQLDVSFMPFVLAVMFAASASFMTPLGYQTNLMVLGPGGYRFTDYLQVGAPMSLLVGAVVVGLVPLVWSF